MYTAVNSCGPKTDPWGIHSATGMSMGAHHQYRRPSVCPQGRDQSGALQCSKCQALFEVCLAAFCDQQFHKRLACRGGEGYPPPGRLHAAYCFAGVRGMSRRCA